MSDHLMLRRAILLSGAAFTSFVSASVSAQEAAPASQAGTESAQAAEQADDIVVTAQFREQRLQDIPLAITALNGDALEAKGANTVLDVANSAPNVTMRQGGGANGGAAQVFIRGIGQADSQFAYEPGVGIYIDDVYYGTTFGAVFDLLDLDRVEVLRGPQGTLSGRNSIGGAVKLFAKRPANEDSGYIEAAIGSFQRRELRGSANFVVVPDRIYARLSGIAKRSDGYLDRIDFGCLYPQSGVPAMSGGSNGCKLGTEGGRDFQGARLALRILPIDDVEINLSATLVNDRSEVAPQKLVDITTQQNFPAGLNSRSFITGPRERSNYATYLNAAFTDPARYNGVPGAGAHPATTLEPQQRLNAKMFAATVNWRIGDNAALTSITAYQEYEGSNVADIDLTPYSINLVSQEFGYKQFTQELRLSGKILDGLIDYTIGGFYFNAKARYRGATYNLPGSANENLFSQDDRIPSESKSVFAHATVNVTDQLSLIGGIRYTSDRKDLFYGRRNPYNLSQPSYTAAGRIDGVSGSYTGDRVDYRLNAQYRFTDNLMGYVQFATGYRAGGVNPRPFVLDQAVPFDPETLKAYEAGFKADFLGRAVRLNGSFFISDYSNIIFVNASPTPTSALNATPVNAGDARYKGVELELNLRPIRAIQIDASASYLDFQFKRIGASGATIVGISLDNKAPFAPEWKMNGGVQYTIDLPGGSTLTPRIDASYQSAFFAQVDNDPRAQVAGYSLVNGRLSWENAANDLQIAASVSNVFDKFYYLSIIKYPIGVVSGAPAAPREWKLSLRKSF